MRREMKRRGEDNLKKQSGCVVIKFKLGKNTFVMSPFARLPSPINIYGLMDASRLGRQRGSRHSLYYFWNKGSDNLRKNATSCLQRTQNETSDICNIIYSMILRFTSKIIFFFFLFGCNNKSSALALFLNVFVA